jgi:hypothetical protein
MRGSMDLLALIKVSAWQALWLGTGYPGVTTHEAAAFPGVVAVVLVVAAFRSTRDPAAKIAARLLILMALVFFAFAVGPRLSFQQDTPVPLAKWIFVPGRIFEWFSFIRWPMRAFNFSLIFIAAAAGLGFTALTHGMSGSQRAVICALVALLLFFEYRPLYSYTADSVAVPDPLAVSDAYPLLASESDRGAIVELPIADSEGSRIAMFALSAYGSAGHLRRILTTRLTFKTIENGEGLADKSAVTRLREFGCSRVVIHHRWVTDSQVESIIAAARANGLPVLWESEESVVFSLQP